MFDPVLFSDSNYSTVIHAKEFLIKYEQFFNWSSNFEDILEVGCANGCVTKDVLYPLVKDRLHHLTGTDISHSAIEYAQKSNNNPDLSFETLDITNENECDNYIEKFHRIFAFYVFHIAHKPELWSRNIFKMLKHKGQIFGYTVVDYPNFCNVVTEEQRNDQSKPWSKYMKNVPDIFYDYGPKPIETVEEIFKQAGFLVNVIEVEPKKVVFKNIIDLKSKKDSHNKNSCYIFLFVDTFTSANHILNYIPKELHDDYLNDFFTKLLKYITYNIDGSYEFIFQVLIFLATKP